MYSDSETERSGFKQQVSKELTLADSVQVFHNSVKSFEIKCYGANKIQSFFLISKQNFNNEFCFLTIRPNETMIKYIEFNI